MFRNLGPFEILVILAIVLLLFGAAKLPQIGHSLGRSFREFKNGISGTGYDEKAASKPAAAPESKDGAGKLQH